VSEEKAIEQMTNEELVEMLADEAFEYGAQTDREKKLEAEILKRMERH